MKPWTVQMIELQQQKTHQGGLGLCGGYFWHQLQHGLVFSARARASVQCTGKMQCVQGLTTYSADIIGGIIRRKNKELCVCVSDFVSRGAANCLYIRG